MRKYISFFTMLLLLYFFAMSASPEFGEDVIPTSQGDLTLTFIGHGTLMFSFQGKIIHIDPVGRYADYTQLPKADIILVTHEHGDHLDAKAIEVLTKANTDIILTEKCLGKYEGGIVMKNGESKILRGIKVEAVPAYNIKHMRSADRPYHPKGEGNGYILTLGNKRIYVAGDTENTPEIKALKDIDIAFLPMNLPYTMDPEMVVDAARAFRPKILYPYHFGRTDTQELVELLKDETDIEVRIRDLK